MSNHIISNWVQFHPAVFTRHLPLPFFWTWEIGYRF